MSDAAGDPLGELTELPGVGPARAAALAAAGIGSVRELLLFAPRRLEEWDAAIPIAQARGRRGGLARVAGRVLRARLSRTGGRRSVLRVGLADGTGELDALFFNQPWLREQLVVGRELELRGRIASVKGAPVLAAPRIGTEGSPLPAAGSLVPLYAPIEGLGQGLLRQLVERALERHGAQLVEPLDAEVLERAAVPSLAAAVREAHRPSSPEAWAAALRRLALEPALRLQAALFAREGARASGEAPRIEIDGELDARLRARFPFELTEGQKRATAELARDLARSAPMRRLLHGDVGSGKTAVALWAAMAVAERGLQVALMAPTELLAEQHALSVAPLLDAAGIEWVRLTGSLRPRERREALARMADGRARVAIGTHALFGPQVRFARLALAIVDEQQRFGVGQRAALARKGEPVHTLLLTATPIPRTLALTLYGGVEVTLLAEAPPGRGQVRTRWVRGARSKLLPFLDGRLARGERAYWVCPRIGEDEEEEDGDAAPAPAAARRFERLARSPLAAHGLELVHGRVPAEERAARLERFRRGDSRLLVATTVIEVGVDVPEATLLVVEGAERFGLAQLHQLRGRIGRGAGDGWCLLLGGASGRERFELLERTRDGFVLAEEDLRQRGMGELAGLRQSGRLGEGLVELDLDPGLLLAARDAVRADPELAARYSAGAAPLTP